MKTGLLIIHPSYLSIYVGFSPRFFDDIKIDYDDKKLIMMRKLEPITVGLKP